MGFVETDDILPQAADDEPTQFCKYGFPYDCPYSTLTRCNGIRCNLNGVWIRLLDKTGKSNRESVTSRKGCMGDKRQVRKINFK